MINVAVIGAGYWGTKLIGEYSNLSKKRKDVKLRAIVDVSSERLVKVSGELGLSNLKLETDYNKILDDPDITCVHVATSNDTHFEIASKAIALGKHVLLEKPMSLHSSEAFKLARQAEKKASVLQVGHIFRFNNSVNKIKELYEQKITGEPMYIELKWAAFLDPPPGREIIFDLAPHPVDILNHIFEEWPVQVYVKASSCYRKQAGLEEVAFVTFVFPKDLIASVSLSWLYHGPRERRMILTNKDNTIDVEIAEQKINVYKKGQVTTMPIDANNTIEAEITHFVDTIKNDDPPINSALTGAMNVTVLEAMRKSLTEDKVVSIFGR